MSSSIDDSFFTQEAWDPQGIFWRILPLIGPGLLFVGGSVQRIDGQGTDELKCGGGLMMEGLEGEISTATGGKLDPGRWLVTRSWILSFPLWPTSRTCPQDEQGAAAVLVDVGCPKVPRLDSTEVILGDVRLRCLVDRRRR